jgi:gluconolactonase
MPERFRQPGKPSAWYYDRPVSEAGCFLEGPTFDRAGNLWVCDIPYGRIFMIDQAGHWSQTVAYAGEPNGLALHRDGWLAIADVRLGLLRHDGERGVQPLLPRVRRENFRGVNDLTFAMNGDLFFTDQGQTGLHDPAGRVFRLRDGASQPELLVGTVPSPNGLVLSADQRTLYVAATRDNAVWRVPLAEDGGVIRVGRFIAMSGGLAGPDGMALDQAGNVAVAHAGMGTVWLFSRLGEPLLRIRSPAGLGTTNVAFGGPDGRDLFITESETGAILRTRLAVAGLELFSHA